MKSLLTTCLLLFAMALSAQCPMDLVLATQLDIDNFAIDYPGCTAVNGNLTISGITTKEILNLDGLTPLETITGNLVIQNNEDQTSISGLGNLTSVGGAITIDDVPDLASLSALSNLNVINGNFILKNNSVLTDLSGLDNISSITGNLELLELGNVATFSALSNLTSLGGNLRIVFNPDILNLNGLTGITSVADLEVSNNFFLQSLTGLDNLTTVSNSFRVNNNSNLLNCSGLDKLTSIGFFAEILSNFDMTSLTGLEALTMISGRLNLSNNPKLASLSGLSELSSIGFQLNISNNSMITNLSGLEKLTSVGGQLEIVGNGNLTALTGIDNITSVAGDVNINGNTSLTDCVAQSICDYLEAPTGTIVISANGAGCSSNAQVSAACAATPVELINFHGELQMSVTNLTWSTATEIDNRGFQVEHSTDGTNFKNIGFMPGVGETREEQTYFFQHNNPSKGYNYYRLKQMDYDDSFEYSHAIAITNFFDGLRIYPNPGQGQFNIAGYLPEFYKVIVSNIQGKEVMIIENHVGKTLDLEALDTGVYFIQIFDQYHPEVLKVVVE